MDPNIGKNVVEKGRVNNRDLCKQPEKQGDLVHTGTAYENPKHGVGGGKQYSPATKGSKSLVSK